MASGRGATVALDGFGAEQGFDVLAEGARRAARDGIRVRVFGPPEQLGLRGIAVVGHGSSGADGVANAVRLAARCAEVDAVGRTAALLREGGAGRGALASGEGA